MEDFSKEVADHLGVDVLPVVFDDSIDDDSNLVIVGEAKIVVNSKHKGDYLECAKCIAHEYRHAFQIYWVTMMPNDPMSKIWKEELKHALVSGFERYESQAIEIDAFAFTQQYLKQYEGLEVTHPNESYQQKIDDYILEHEDFL